MIFEEAQAHGGWQEHTALDLADEGLQVFVEAVKAALSNSSGQY